MEEEALQYTTTTVDPESMGALAAVSGTLMTISLLVSIVILAALWKVFTKAGKPGWAAIVPFYNVYVLLQIVGRDPRWALAMLAIFIPVIGVVIVLIGAVILALDVAKVFGRGPVFAVLGLVLTPIGYFMLALGKDKYLGPIAESSSKAGAVKSDATA